MDAVAEPPTAPVPLLPADGAVVEERRPALVVENATSPDGLALTYTFELESVADDGSTTPVERVESGRRGPADDRRGRRPSTWPTAPTSGARARPTRGRTGRGRPTWRFDVLVDPPPAAPTGLRAVAGDARVRLDWNASPEPDVTGYRVYRSTTAGGPHAFVAAVADARRSTTSASPTA